MIVLIAAVGVVALLAGLGLWWSGFFAKNSGRHADVDFDWDDEARQVRLSRPDLDPDTLEPLPDDLPWARRPAAVVWPSMLPLNARAGVWQPRDVPSPVSKTNPSRAGDPALPGPVVPEHPATPADAAGLVPDRAGEPSRWRRDPDGNLHADNDAPTPKPVLTPAEEHERLTDPRSTFELLLLSTPLDQLDALFDLPAAEPGTGEIRAVFAEAS